MSASRDIRTEVKQIVREEFPSAEILLYGSRARGDAHPESDWDFLILVDSDEELQKAEPVKRQLDALEWESGEAITTIFRTKDDWNQSLTRATPFHKNVETESVSL